MSTFTNTAREVEMPNGDVVVIHNAPTGGENTTSNIKKFKYDDNGHVTESTAADAEDLNLSSYSTPTTGTTAIGTSDDIQTAIGKLDHQSHIDQTNILYSLRNGAKNFVNLFDTISSRSCTATELENGGMRLVCTNAVWTQYFVNINLKPNTQYVLYTNMSNFSGSSIGAISIRVQYIDERGHLVQYKPTQTGEHVSTFTTESTTDLKLSVLINDSDTARTQSIDIWVMICEKVIYDADSSYVSCSLSNSDLTYLQAEDRASLVEVVDSGAKNKINYNGSPWNSDLARLQAINANGTWSGNTFTMNGVTATINSDGTVTTSGTATGGSFIFTFVDLNSATSTYTGDILSGCPNGGDYSTKYAVYLADASGNTTIHTTSTDGVAIPSTAVRYIRVLGRQGTNMNGLTFKPMICTKAAFGISKAFVPYRPNYDLVVSEIGHHVVDDGNTNHSTATCNCSNWTAGVYLVAVNRYQNPTTAYGTALYLMTVNDNILPLFTTIVETADCKAIFALSNDKVLSITYPHSAFWQAYAKRI